MDKVQSIESLRQLGWSQRRIAETLDIDRETVARYVGRPEAGSKPAQAPLGAGEEAGSKPAQAPLGAGNPEEGSCPRAAEALPAPQRKEGAAGVTALRGSSSPVRLHGDDNVCAASLVTPTEDSAAAATGSQTEAPRDGSAAAASRSACQPWLAIITAKLDQGLNAQRIYQDLVGEHAFSGSYYSVRRLVQRLGQSRDLPFRRLECAAGAEVQVDFGKGAAVVGPDGRRRRPHVFRLVLSHSRKGYSEAVWRQTTEAFLRCLENAFCSFGGAPETVVLDNLKAAVTTPDWYDPELNPKLQAFAAHYGVALLPTKSYTPRHKGKIERGIGYVQDNGLKGRTFASLDEQNQHLRQWEESVADTRLHGTTRQQVGKVFAAVERPALRPLPAERFPFFHEGRRRVHRDGHVEVDKAYYSVPPEYLGREVWVRWDARLVRLFNQRWEEIAIHVKHEPGRFSTHAQHVAAAKISNVERGASYLLSQVSRIGAQTARWAQTMLQERGIEGVRVLQGLLSLAKRHASADLERACGTALSYGAYRLRTLRTLLQRHAPAQQQFDFIAEHPLIRSLTDYAALVHNSFHKESRP